MTSRRVVVVGGGITGLSTAYFLEKRARERGEAIDVTVVERSKRWGGNIVTELHDQFTIDGGPDSWVAAKPHATLLAKELGLENSIIGTNEETRRVYVMHDDELKLMPEGVVLGIPTEVMPLAKSSLLSWRAKVRMAFELLVKPRVWRDDDDESVGDFISRRLGAEVTDRLAGPLLGGIFAGDAHQLSVRATFPQLVDAERKYGSLIRAMRAAKRKAAGKSSGAQASAFLSLRGGMGTLINALVGRLGKATLRLETTVVSITANERSRVSRYTVHFDDGASVEADDIVFAMPVHVTARMIRALDQEIARDLEQMRYASTATVFTAFRRADITRPLDAFGFIVPRSAGRQFLASTWVSSKWRGRAPDDTVLIRLFFGGAWGEQVLEESDNGLTEIALRELRSFLGTKGEPLFSRVFRFDKASPQPPVGHLATMARIGQGLERWPGLHIAGSGVDGVGIPDCVRQAETIAERILGARQA